MKEDRQLEKTQESKPNRARRTLSKYQRTLILLVALLAPLALADDDEPLTSFLTEPTTTFDGFFPTPWGCDANPGTQDILEFHLNWHCNNPDKTGVNWGSRFFGFHKQFGFGFNQHRAANGFPYTQTWVAAPGAPIPPPHGGRPADAPCTDCLVLPDQFRLPAAGGTLDTFPSVSSIGSAIVGWHNENHVYIADAGGSGDMNSPVTSPRDPIFYRYHHIFDDVQNAWRTHQDTDIVLVFDRSGSMSLPAVGGGTRLQAATDAANMFADLMEDGSSHNVGLVSFSTAASSPADMPLTPVAGAPAAMSAALAGVSASGSTSIGDGLQEAVTTLSAGANSRKAVLLLTDGMENTAPLIADAQASLGDTHLCSVGFGTPGSLDGPKLRDLSERQGGIYISGPGALELRKFFVECFANIFDTFVGEDPIEILPAGQSASNPLTHVALGDDKLVFVLSWDEPSPKGALKLQITSPSGQVVDLSDAAVESEVGDTWHIVRFDLPHMGEGDGSWEARAVRAPLGYVNGFMSDAFEDLFAGAELIRAQLRLLCAAGCERVLFYEDDAMGRMQGEMNFDMMRSAYSEAIFNEVPTGTIGEATRVRDPQEFAERLRKRDFDLLVYSSRYAREKQPYDDLLVRTMCDEDAPRAILSDNRRTDDALETLRCAGAVPTDDVNFETILSRGELGEAELRLTKPQMTVGPFSYALQPSDDTASVLATGPNEQPVVVARGVRGEDQAFFTTTLTRAPARVLPFTWISHTYTGEELHPTFHIPEMYWPEKGYDTVKAVVEVTRPLRSLGELAAEVGVGEADKLNGDLIDPRTAALLRLDPNGTGDVIPTETLSFELFDDGTNGDGTAGDHYWEVSLPPEVAEFDGSYDLHAIFTLCQGDTCVQREASHTLEVETKLSPDTTEVDVEQLEPENRRNRTRITIIPRDAAGRLVGPGLANAILVDPLCDATVEEVRDADGRGSYEVIVSWVANEAEPFVEIGQFGRPGDSLKVSLR